SWVIPTWNLLVQRTPIGKIKPLVPVFNKIIKPLFPEQPTHAEPITFLPDTCKTRGLSLLLNSIGIPLVLTVRKQRRIGCALQPTPLLRAVTLQTYPTMPEWLVE